MVEGSCMFLFNGSGDHQASMFTAIGHSAQADYLAVYFWNRWEVWKNATFLDIGVGLARCCVPALHLV